MRIFLGVAADDFTGASDAASLIASTCMPTILLNGIPDDIKSVLDAVCQNSSSVCSNDPVCSIVIATKTRNLPAAEAVFEMLRCFDFLKSIGAEKLYFKYCATFDSTAAGNIGPVADAVLERYGIPYTLIVPALPVNGRTVKDGILYVNGIPLAESHMKDHPLTPMHESELKKLMEMQSAYLTYNIGMDLLSESRKVADSGTADIKVLLSDIKNRHLNAQSMQHFYLAPDYYKDEHGRLIAENFYELQFFTGGSGLCRELADAFMRKHADLANTSTGFRMDTSQSSKEDSFSTGSYAMNTMPLGSEHCSTSTAAYDIAAATDSIKTTVCTVAASSILNATAENRTEVLSAAADTPRAIILAGSCSKVTLNQIAEFKAAGGLGIQVIPRLLLNGEQTADTLFCEAQSLICDAVHTENADGMTVSRLTKPDTAKLHETTDCNSVDSACGNNTAASAADNKGTLLTCIRNTATGRDNSRLPAVLIYSSQSPEEMEESRQLGMEQVSAAIEKLMGKLAVKSVSEGCRSLICAGGETSGAIVEALGFDAFYIGKSVAPGVPILIPVQKPELRIVLKSGGFGQPDFFARAVFMTAAM